MTGGFPLLGGIANITNYNFSAATQSYPVQLTAIGSANTKSAYTQLTASSSFDAAGLSVYGAIGGVSGNASFAYDIAVGGAGSEVVIVSNAIGIGQPSGTFLCIVDSWPISIRAGTRIAARYQCSDSTGEAYLGIGAYDGSFVQSQASTVESVGFSTATTLGTAVTAGAADTKGSYAQLVASTTFDYLGFWVGLDYRNATPDVAGGDNVLIDIAIGGAGSETVIVPNLYMKPTVVSSIAVITPQRYGFFPIPIPAATRIAARCQNSIASKVMGVTLYGLR